MDRFNTNSIFGRLREVNTLANIQLQKENKILRFFYLLRDDIFVSKDRTKFFDFILPIVPVVDSSNSYDQIISLFEKSGVLKEFDYSFLQGLSLYIDDMRLLKNIYNEFLIYYNRINITELDCNKMLSIIAYKNLFPQDFGNLQLNQGFVYTLFNSKDIFIAEEIKKLDEQISVKNHEIEMAKNEHLKTIEELDIVFETRKPVDLWKHKQNLSETDKKEYDERKKAIENRLNNKIPKLEDEKLVLEKELILIRNKQLHEIITRENINSIFSVKSTNVSENLSPFNDINSSEYFNLLKYLIRNGYIDETYADYMTYFYENSLSRIDKIFLRSVTDKKSKEYTYQLKNPELVLSRLRLVDFDQEEILNFDLLTYLLHTLSPVEYLEKYIDQLKDTKNFKFIGAYFDTTTELPTYIKYLNMRWPEIFVTALSEKSLTEKQIRRYSICSLYYSDDTTIQLVNKDNLLCHYISNSRDYLAIEDPDIDKLIHGFNILGVCFIGFDYDVINKELFRAIYEESLYEINSENIQLMQREILGITNDEDILHKNYTLLFSYPDSTMTQYVNHNINKYFDIILQMSEGIINDDENFAVTVLNNSDITIEQKHSYIKALQTPITLIKEITDISLWSLLMDTDIVLYSEQNIVDYFKAVKSLDKSIVSYINKCNIDLDFSKTEYDSEANEALFDCVIVCNSIENSKYEQILTSFDFYYTNFNVNNIADDKIVILIDTNIISMTAGNLRFMRKNYISQLFYFIQNNINKYVEIMNNDLFDQDELLEIITWNISDEHKIKLLEFSDDKISIIGMNYSTAVCLYILNNNFMESDLDSLFISFEQWDDSIQQKIFDFAIRNIISIIDNPEEASEKLKNDLIHSERLDRDTKIDLLIAMLPKLNDDYIKEILTMLDLTSYIKIFNTHSRPKFEINNENKKLLTAFKKKGLINNYEENPKKEGYYKIIIPKPVKQLEC